MVSGHIGRVGPHVTSPVAREGNYEQEDVRIQCQKIKEGIVLEKVYRVVYVQKKTVQVLNSMIIKNNKPIVIVYKILK
jgi:hypothetical protein